LREASLKKFAATFAIIISLILIMVKFFAWRASGSVSLLSSLVDSTVDFGGSLLSFFAIYHSLKPADRHYRFGHGKIEALAALIQSLLIFASSFLIFKEAVNRFSNPEPMEEIGFAIGATVISLLLTMVLLLVQKYVIRKTASLAIEADCAHYESDFLINIGVLLVVGCSYYFDSTVLDPIFGGLVAIYILTFSYKILRRSWEILMDKELPDDDREKIKRIILSHPMVSGYHLLRTRSSGTGEFIQCHLEMPGDITLLEAYTASQEVEQNIRGTYPKADIILHQDPAQILEEHRSSL
jgi:ferrous-iron efflux pump FieF